MSFLTKVKRIHAAAETIDWVGKPCDNPAKILKSMRQEYFHLPPEVKEAAVVGKRCYIHRSKNLDLILENPSRGMIATVKEILPHGLVVKIGAHVVNTNLIHWHDGLKKMIFSPRYGFSDQHIFVTFPGLKKAAMNAYVHCADTENVNSGLVYIGCMSSSIVK